MFKKIFKKNKKFIRIGNCIFNKYCIAYINNLGFKPVKSHEHPCVATIQVVDRYGKSLSFEVTPGEYRHICEEMGVE